MSMFMGKRYCKCGEPIQGDPSYCKHCGMKIGEVEEGKEMNTITDAVREVTNTASDEKRDAKYNQQKWGLFETNYQREKGISTEQSLQEIEEFSRNGTVPTPAPKREATVGGDFRDKLDKCVHDHEEKEKQKKEGFVKRLSNRFSRSNGSRRGTGSTTAPKAGPAVSEFADRLKNQSGANAGAEFFAKFQQKEKQKFQPQYR